MVVHRLQRHIARYFEILDDTIQDHFGLVYMDVSRTNQYNHPEYVIINKLMRYSRQGMDKSNATTITSAPVVKTFNLVTQRDIELRNNDTVTLKIVNSKGQIMDVYRSTIGDRATLLSGNRAELTIAQLGRDLWTPENLIPVPQPEKPPQPDDVIITVNFKDTANNMLRDSIVHIASIGDVVLLEALELHGFKFYRSYLDGEEINTSEIELTAKNPAYNLTFVYESVNVPIYLRVFANSRYIRNDGTSANGLHLYKKVPITWIEQDGDILRFYCDINILSHQTGGQTMRFQAPTRFKLFPQEYVGQFISNVRDGDRFLIEARQVTPTTAEDNAYITLAYDD